MVSCRLRAAFPFPLSRSRTFAEAGPRKQQLLEFSKKKPAVGYIAQWLERLTADQQVPSSNPSVPCFNTRPWFADAADAADAAAAAPAAAAADAAADADVDVAADDDADGDADNDADDDADADGDADGDGAAAADDDADDADDANADAAAGAGSDAGC